MMNGIVALHSPPMRKDAAKKNGTLFRSVGCLGSRITSELFTLKFKYVGAKCYLALLLRSNRSLLMLLRRRFFALSSLWTGALMDTRREQAKRVVRNGKKDTTTSPLCWTAGANTVVSDQDQEPIRIWILTCRWVLTVGILPGSWWAYHELGQGGWWFRDPIENASFMPRIASSRSLFATDDTRGIFLWQFFLLMTDISMILFSQMKQQALVRRAYKKEMVMARVLLEWVIHRAGTLITTVRPTPASILAECGTGSFHGNTTSTAASQYSLAPMYVTQFTGPENLHLGACLVPGETVNFAKARGPLLLCLKLRWQSFSLACTRDPKEVDFEPAYAKQRSQHPRPWGLVTGLMDAIISWEFFSLWLTGRGHNFLMRIQPARAISSVADAENRHSILCFPSTDLSGRMLESALLQLVVFKSEIAFTSHMKSVPTDFFGNQLAPSSSGDAARLRSHLSSLPQSTLRKRQVQLLYFRVDPASFRVSIRAGVLSDLVMSFSRSLLL
ncbi:putative cytochrome c biosynthesis protein [Capsicum annuum]|uniref:Cytochrome c biosynthesis protein n=1 Tax=Capsicum annuum TaxID=4072 RepID=A0A2G2YYZ1_CAPAN|nr:putative cytochrome c biosynthesis protein [Capsicum annuum]